MCVCVCVYACVFPQCKTDKKGFDRATVYYSCDALLDGIAVTEAEGASTW